jgi:tellurite resistance protein
MSTRVTMQERRKALEEEFFQKEERKKLDQLREKAGRDRSIDELKGISGIADAKVLGDLVDAGVDAETLVAFTLVPLVAVAWASGSVSDAEREAVLRAAAESGVREGTAARDSLERMLRDKPPRRSLLKTWASYASSLYQSLGEKQRERLASDVTGRARDVASAAGGFLGIGAVSAEEEAVLEEIAAVFR